MCHPRYLLYDAGVPIIGAVKGSSILWEGSGRFCPRQDRGMELAGGHLVCACLGRPGAFVTSASLLAYARNYCLRGRGVSV
jgi:hypothetical protein